MMNGRFSTEINNDKGRTCGLVMMSVDVMPDYLGDKTVKQPKNMAPTAIQDLFPMFAEESDGGLSYSASRFLGEQFDRVLGDESSWNSTNCSSSCAWASNCLQ